MSRAISILILPFIAVVALLVLASVYIVDVREKALVLRFGEVVDVRENPGMGLKVPFIDNVMRYDARILGIPTPPMEVTPLDDRRLVVDAFARWQITDVVQFRRATAAGGIQFAQQRLADIVTNAIRQVLGSVPSTTVLSDDRTPLMNQIRDLARENARDLGVRIIDVRLTRTDLPEQNLTATYARMRAEREREAADEIARGGEAAQRVRAAADRTVVELTSEARKKAEIVRGEADARRNSIYAEAFGRDPEFFAFTRSMTSYERALKGENSSLVIQPEGQFFDYLRTDGADRANPVPAASNAALSVVTGTAVIEPETEEPVVGGETNREGQPLGEAAGVTLTPMPESLATPPQSETVVPAVPPAN
ncbi:MAG TPA: protease modulator HflC [Paracoccus sp. (in: a-proteobacteria)]|uniref:protease modulator HflC n=1 Tax=Paracoccus sp. TaxID=267 RepID=UPI002B537C62|nr:protease modulator HflC [Paracoccus sp. (in: a-proteobacteria)]HWL55731.1 protease modulator HflC [Paracoccus sp. (in: a-proteobacteria)]